MDSLERIAFHEAGHAIVALKAEEPLCKLVDIVCTTTSPCNGIEHLKISDGTAGIGGVTHFKPSFPASVQELELLGCTPRQLRWCLLVLAGGLAGERVACVALTNQLEKLPAKSDIAAFEDLFTKFATDSYNLKHLFEADGSITEHELAKQFDLYVGEAEKLLDFSKLRSVAEELREFGTLLAERVEKILSA